MTEPTEPIVYPIEDYLYFFAVFDPTTKGLLYTKFNFNFSSYNDAFAEDTEYPLPTNPTRSQSFYNFLRRNGTTFNAPYAVSSELTQYFYPITDEIILYMEKYGYCLHQNYMVLSQNLAELTVDNQFDLIFYNDNEVRRIQDYYWLADGRTDTKWNFDFNQYSNDFNVHSSKLLIFTDFMVRCTLISGTRLGTYGYSTVPSFQKYFYESEGLIAYIEENGVTSNLDNVPKSLNNIDFVKYGQLNNVVGTVDGIKNHYLCYGQFEQLQVPFKQIAQTALDVAMTSVGTIFSGSQVASCFLFNSSDDPENVYIASCFHVIRNQRDVGTIFATFENKQSTVFTAAFQMAGYDMYADIYVAKFNPELSYNLSHDITVESFSSFVPLSINYRTVVKNNEPVSTIGNFRTNTNLVTFSGEVIDENYTGSFNNVFTLPSPDSILTNMILPQGSSGSPLLIGDPLGNAPMKCVGMINSALAEGNYSLAISGFVLSNITTNIILKFLAYSQIYANDLVRLNYFIKNGLNKRWLGTISSYFHPSISTSRWPELVGLPWVGGLIVEEFVTGFNYLTKRWVTDFNALSKQDILQINTPLLKSKMYEKFIYNSRRPIVIKSATYFDGIKSVYEKHYFGKFGNQVSYSNFMYGVAPLGNTRANNGYQNSVDNLYGDVVIEYFYYNGKNWILDSETVGGNAASDYNVYKDNLGYLYHQHKFEFPFVLIPYQDVYSLGVMMSDTIAQKGMVLADTIPQKSIVLAEKKVVKQRRSDGLLADGTYDPYNDPLYKMDGLEY
jgi:hypothetical protein